LPRMDEEFGLLCISEGEAVCVPLLGVRCDVTVEDFIAQIELTQCFHNAEDKPVEALYRFPCDQASSVCGKTNLTRGGCIGWKRKDESRVCFLSHTHTHAHLSLCTHLLIASLSFPSSQVFRRHSTMARW
jgi:hypothetical protein